LATLAALEQAGGPFAKPPAASRVKDERVCVGDRPVRISHAVVSPSGEPGTRNALRARRADGRLIVQTTTGPPRRRRRGGGPARRRRRGGGPPLRSRPSRRPPAPGRFARPVARRSPAHRATR